MHSRPASVNGTDRYLSATTAFTFGVVIACAVADNLKSADKRRIVKGLPSVAPQAGGETMSASTAQIVRIPLPD